MLCLFATFLAKEGLSSQTVSSYLAAVRHLQIEAGFGAPSTPEWPRLHYTVRGIKRLQSRSPRQTRLPITPGILEALCRVWSSGQLKNPYNVRLMWAACCLGFFGFLRAGEFTMANPASSPSVCMSDIAVDSFSAPSLVRVFLRRAPSARASIFIWVELGCCSAQL